MGHPLFRALCSAVPAAQTAHAKQTAAMSLCMMHIAGTMRPAEATKKQMLRAEKSYRTVTARWTAHAIRMQRTAIVHWTARAIPIRYMTQTAEA